MQSAKYFYSQLNNFELTLDPRQMKLGALHEEFIYKVCFLICNYTKMFRLVKFLHFLRLRYT